MTRSTRHRGRWIAAVVTTLAVAYGVVGEPVRAAPSTDIFISEYVDGTFGNQALEIYNGTGAALDTSGYRLEIYENGSPAQTNITFGLGFTLAEGDVFVIVGQFSDPELKAHADVVAELSTFNFDGNDAIVLSKRDNPLDPATRRVVDVIGQVGVDPGTGWGTSPTSTDASTLRRKPSVVDGDREAGDAFDPATEWTSYPVDTFDGLGSNAIAGNTGTVSADVTVSAGACLELSATAVSFGTLALGAENQPATPGYTITNCAGVLGTLLASGTDATGPSALWTLDDTAATCTGTPPLAGDRYHLYDERGATSVSLSTANKTIHTSVTPGVPFTHRLSISTACPGSSGSGKTMSMQVNYTATG